MAQQGEQVITTLSGVQHEGLIFYVPQIAEVIGDYGLFNRGSEIVVVDDGLRLVFLNPNQVSIQFGNSQRNEISFEIRQKTKSSAEGIGSIVWIGPFDKFGHRQIKLKMRTGVLGFVQGITEITPRYCILETLDGNDTGVTPKWEMRISTSRVPKEVLRSVLYARIKNRNDANEFFDIADFFQQAGDFDQARQELRKIETDSPDLKDRIRDHRVMLDQLEARQILDEVRFRLQTGQTKLALALAKAIEKVGLAGEILAEFQVLEEDATEANEKLDQSRRQVFELIKSMIDKTANVSDDEMAAIKRFQTELETELNQVNLARLDAYLRLAKDATLTDDHKISLAISGWFLGSNHAIENLSVAESLFTVRELVREYLTEDTEALRRSQILNEMNGLETGYPKFLDPMMKQMTPIAPPKDLESYTGETAIEFTIEIPGPPAHPEIQTYVCKAHLPAEYDPYRKYPLILSLPGSETLDANLNMWCGGYNQRLSTELKTNIRQGHAMRHGYIVVSVDWRRPGQTRWGNTGREHRVVLDALRQSLRMFSVDSDRVYLSGNGVGGDGAYDVGVSHPEHWAGILGFSGKFGDYVKIYSSNKHVSLPMYCVNGQKDTASIRAMKLALNEKWMHSKGYVNPTVVHYRGRVNETFDEEIPNAFKWMRGHRRVWPIQVGFEFSCATIRPGDSYFWFFEMDGIPNENIVLPELFNRAPKINTTTISGKVVAPNIFMLGPKNSRDGIDATLWLSPEFVDFNKRIEIRGRGKFKDDVKSSSEILLDDVFRRADREHPYWAAVDFTDGKWEARNKD